MAPKIKNMLGSTYLFCDGNDIKKGLQEMKVNTEKRINIDRLIIVSLALMSLLIMICVCVSAGRIKQNQKANEQLMEQIIELQQSLDALQGGEASDSDEQNTF